MTAANHSLQVVGVQLDIAWEDPAENFGRVERLLLQADIRPGALIVLPEMFATGFSMNVERTAQQPSREVEARVAQWARQYQSVVLAGVVGPLETPQQASNEAVAYDAQGKLLARYRKMQPFTPSGEHLHYAAGSSVCSFVWHDMKVSPFVCYDLRFPEVFRPAAVGGAELLVVVANWPSTRSEHWVRLLQARAIENQAYVIGVNRCGNDPKLSYDGRSAAFDPLGQPLFEADARPQAFSVEVEAARVRQWREQFPALRDARISG